MQPKKRSEFITPQVIRRLKIPYKCFGNQIKGRNNIRIASPLLLTAFFDQTKMINSIKYLRGEKTLEKIRKDIQLERERKQQKTFDRRRKDKRARNKRLLERYEEQKMITNVRNKL